jgi:hypothetical protein
MLTVGVTVVATATVLSLFMPYAMPPNAAWIICNLYIRRPAWTPRARRPTRQLHHRQSSLQSHAWLLTSHYYRSCMWANDLAVAGGPQPSACRSLQDNLESIGFVHLKCKTSK